MVISSLSEHDRRQLIRIAERCDLFSSGAIPLGVLVADIEFLISACEAVDLVARRSLLDAWGVLEEWHSAAIVLDGGHVGRDGLVAIAAAVARLRATALQSAGDERPLSHG